MTIERVAPTTVDELAAMSCNTTTLYFGVGTAEGDELLRITAANLNVGESLVMIANGAGCLAEIESTERTPAIGAWCAGGVLIGYEYDLTGIAYLMKEARRFA